MYVISIKQKRTRGYNN